MSIPKVAFIYVGKNGKVYNESDFANMAIEAKKVIVVGAIGLIIFLGNGDVVFATGAKVVKEAAAEGSNIGAGLKPLIDLFKDLAEPVSYGYMIKGFLKFMSGKEEEGKKELKAAGAGYIGIQFIPQFFNFIKNTKLF